MPFECRTACGRRPLEMSIVCIPVSKRQFRRWGGLGRQRMKNFGTRTALTLVSTFTLVFAACGGDDGRTGPRGETGANALTSTRDEPPGANCPEGGQAISIGYDLNEDLELDQEEIENTAYVCNGEPGEPGDATDVLIETVDLEPDDDRCENGGVEIRFGADAND